MPERVAAIVAGIAEGCVQAGCALIGGETAEHPGHFGPDDFDLAGAATGVVEADQLLGPDRVRPGDVVIALASSGLHSNGFSLVRQVIETAGLDLAAEPAELGQPLGEELLTPTTDLRPGLPGPGGRTATCTRSPTSPAAGWRRTWRGCCRPDADAVLDRGSWRPPPVFGLLAARGGIGGRRDGAGLQHGGRDGRRGGRRLTPTGRSACWRSAA